MQSIGILDKVGWTEIQSPPRPSALQQKHFVVTNTHLLIKLLLNSDSLNSHD
jgi:hypothetical protein